MDNSKLWYILTNLFGNGRAGQADGMLTPCINTIENTFKKIGYAAEAVNTYYTNLHTKDKN